MDQWNWDKRAELQRAHTGNHFQPPTPDTVKLTGDESQRSFEFHLKKCANLIALCEIFASYTKT